MQGNDNNLLNFLQKRSLFQQSTTKSMMRKISRSKSREAKDDIKSIIDQLSESHSKKASAYQKFGHDTSEEQLKRGEQKGASLNPNFLKYDKPIKKTSSRLVLENDAKEMNKSNSNNMNSNFPNTNTLGFNNYRTGLPLFASNFESARVESAQCLQTLSLKLGTQISNINYRIDKFSKQMSKFLASQLKVLRETILTIVNEAFWSTEKMIDSFVKSQQQKIAKDALKMRQILEKEYIEVQNMKYEINTSQWRRTTGSLLSADLQNNIKELLRRAGKVQLDRWDFKDFGGQSLMSLKTELKKLASLQKPNNFR